MASEEDLQQKYMQFKVLQEHIEKLSEQLQQLTEHAQEIEVSKAALVELATTTVDTEVLCPISNGIFIKGTLKDNTQLIVNVGADTAVEKTVDEVTTMLDVQKKELKKKIAEGEEILQHLHQQAMSLYRELDLE